MKLGSLRKALQQSGGLGLIGQFMQEEHEFEVRQYNAEESAENEFVARPVTRTLEEISRGTGLSQDEIRKTMKDEEGEMFMHLPHPVEPTRYALAAHVADAQGWQPGLDF